MNEITQGKGFYISYNPSPGMGMNMFAGDNNSDETALVKEGKDKNTFYILNGDFRKEYKKLIKKGYKACYKFYLSKKEKFNSSWTTPE